MAIKLYNTMNGNKEGFIPKEEGKVGIYVCGPTTYNYIHLGNARPLVAFDVVRRYFIYRGYDVTYVQNFTDVDDKIINRAREEGIDPFDLANKYIDAFFEDTGKLGVMKADVHPKVTEHINDIIHMVQTIIDNGYAYEVNGDVYYEVRKFKDYGKLSGRTIDDLQAGARIAVDEQKRDPLDFALWKAAKEGEPSWDSPWGKGRPGWHIECSAMSLKYLGEGFDIHGGGADLVFPHHENEIAQSEACCGSTFSRYWMHNGFITINSEKMSKSLGNFFLLRDILEKFKPEVVRYYLMATHYRSPLDFDDQKLDSAAKSLARIHTSYNLVAEKVAALKNTVDGGSKYGAELDSLIGKTRESFIAAMDDDFNTALALGGIFDFCREINSIIAKDDLGNDKETLAALNRVLGLFSELHEVMPVIVPEKADTDDMSDSLMNLILEIRQKARAEKNYGMADFIRDQLKELAIKIEDTPNGARWKKED